MNNDSSVRAVTKEQMLLVRKWLHSSGDLYAAASVSIEHRGSRAEVDAWLSIGDGTRVVSLSDFSWGHEDRDGLGDFCAAVDNLHDVVSQLRSACAELKQRFVHTTTTKGQE